MEFVPTTFKFFNKAFYFLTLKARESQKTKLILIIITKRRPVENQSFKLVRNRFTHKDWQSLTILIMTSVTFSVSDPDWIRIQSVQWIRIRINPSPGGKKLPTKIEKVKKCHVLKCLMLSF
jgi:hypothetical protein